MIFILKFIVRIYVFYFFLIKYSISNPIAPNTTTTTRTLTTTPMRTLITNTTSMNNNTTPTTTTVKPDENDYFHSVWFITTMVCLGIVVLQFVIFICHLMCKGKK